ncbi:MAG: hypothetical protein M3Y27_16930 [Acidobacteriota bacterium]|nr:hypothetical protein [Acidobacteriota bacterium]
MQCRVGASSSKQRQLRCQGGCIARPIGHSNLAFLHQNANVSLAKEFVDKISVCTSGVIVSTLAKSTTTLGETLREFYYSLLSGHWQRVADPNPGYSIVMPVVPEFYSITEWNLRFLFACDLTHCNELILVADSWAFRHENMALFQAHAGSPLVNIVVPGFQTRQ